MSVLGAVILASKHGKFDYLIDNRSLAPSINRSVSGPSPSTSKMKYCFHGQVRTMMQLQPDHCFSVEQHPNPISTISSLGD